MRYKNIKNKIVNVEYCLLFSTAVEFKTSNDRLRVLKRGALWKITGPK
jgi:hypothetical protein